MTAIDAQRRFYAEEIQAVANLATPAVIEALATIPRERFLPPGPWTVRGEADYQAPPRQTPDADPRHVHHNLAVAIDPARLLFNGAPSTVAMAIDAMQPRAGERVLHIGTGLGYYTALLGHCVGATGRVVAIEIDPGLAEGTRLNLGDMPWVDVRQGDATAGFDESFDLVLVNAGATHPLPSWLDALSPAGRMVVPITAAFGPAPIGKGPLLLLSKGEAPERLSAKVIGFVAIFSALGVRSEALNALVGRALSHSPFAAVKSFRRDPHTADGSCWLHADTGCFSLTA
jgi:protein-L-isoaspartate(D-aspartate) O-methyltransferase